jgi:hypothetical protein
VTTAASCRLGMPLLRCAVQVGCSPSAVLLVAVAFGSANRSQSPFDAAPYASAFRALAFATDPHSKPRPRARAQPTIARIADEPLGAALRRRSAALGCAPTLAEERGSRKA